MALLSWSAASRSRCSVRLLGWIATPGRVYWVFGVRPQPVVGFGGQIAIGLGCRCSNDTRLYTPAFSWPQRHSALPPYLALAIAEAVCGGVFGLIVGLLR